MAFPTSYTESTFKTFLHNELRAVADVLGWTVDGGDYDEILNDALFAYDTDDITTITTRATLKKLRVLGRVALWRAVVNATAGDYDFSADGGSYSRSQIHEQAQNNLDDAITQALVYDEAYQVGVTTITYDDYYDPPDLTDDDYA